MFDAIWKVHFMDDSLDSRDANMFVQETSEISKASGFRMFYGNEWTQN